jgi:low affinity Fe/Cu permease
MDRVFERLAQAVTRWTGSTWATLLAFLAIVVWLAFGPFFDFSTDYQMYVNTGTTIVTFLMVFLIQRTQNKGSLAIQLKLNELVAAVRGASNRLIGVEDLSEAEVRSLGAHYRALVELARQEGDITCSHSIEEAEGRHLEKLSPLRRDGLDGKRPAGEAPPGRGSAPRQDEAAGGSAGPSAEDRDRALAALKAELAACARAAAKLQQLLRRQQEQVEAQRSGLGRLPVALPGEGPAAPPTPTAAGGPR